MLGLTRPRKVYYFYAAIAIEKADGTRYAYVDRIPDTADITERYQLIGNGQKAMFGNLFPTKKAAEETVAAWDETFKKQGLYDKFGGTKQ